MQEVAFDRGGISQRQTSLSTLFSRDLTPSLLFGICRILRSEIWRSPVSILNLLTIALVNVTVVVPDPGYQNIEVEGPMARKKNWGEDAKTMPIHCQYPSLSKSLWAADLP